MTGGAVVRKEEKFRIRCDPEQDLHRNCDPVYRDLADTGRDPVAVSGSIQNGNNRDRSSGYIISFTIIYVFVLRRFGRGIILMPLIIVEDVREVSSK